MIDSVLLVFQLILEKLDQCIRHTKIDSKTEPIVLDGLNYVVWVTDMDTLLKSKGI